MNYPCNLVRDLLPLYEDGVCSEESKRIVEQHLLECPSCKEFYAAMIETDKFEMTVLDADRESQKAASFRAVKRKLLQKQVLVVVIAFILLFVMGVSVAGVLKNSMAMIPYEDNISVSMTDDSLIGRLQGNRANRFKIKRVEVTVEGEPNTYLFFCLFGTKWDALTTSNEVFSEYVLCPADKGAEQIDSVFYYTGDYTEIESMSQDQLREVVERSILLWSK